MSLPLVPDVWRVLFLYLDQHHVFKLRCIGDRRVAGLIERRESAFYFGAGIEAKLAWPKRISKDSELRILEVNMDSESYDIISPYPSCILPQKLVYLKLRLCAGVRQFVVSDVADAPSKIAQLDEMLPLLRYLDIFGSLGSLHYVAPTSVTHLVSGFSYHHGSVPLPPNLISLDCQINKIEFLDALPLSLESLKLHTYIPIRDFSEASRLQRLVNLKALTYTCVSYKQLSGPAILRQLLQLPRTLTSLRLEGFSFEDDLRFPDWLPKSLVSLYVEANIPIGHYSSLPRSLKHVVSRNGTYSGKLIQEHRWDISGGNYRRGKVIPPSDVFGLGDDRLQTGLFEAGLEPLPPALQHLRLGTFAPAHVPDWMEQLSTHFTPGLTSLDMRCTSRIDASQFVHLPVTLTLLNFEGITLPKVKHLHRLPKLRTLGLYGGILTTSIARAIPLTITALTLAQVALITKGHFNVNGDPTKFERCHQRSPQIAPLGLLPPRLQSFTLIPSNGHPYWDQKLTDILQIIPYSNLETLIIDLKSDTLFKAFDVFLRFGNLKHLFYNYPNQEAPASFAKLFACLPPSLTALHVPDAFWRLPRWSPPGADPTLSPVPSPPLLRFVNAWEASIRVHFGSNLRFPLEYIEFSQAHSVLTTCRSSRAIAERYRAPLANPLDHLYKPSVFSFVTPQ